MIRALVSVIVSSYRRPSAIARALEPVLAQTLCPAELILIGIPTVLVLWVHSLAEFIHCALVILVRRLGKGPARNPAAMHLSCRSFE